VLAIVAHEEATQQMCSQAKQSLAWKLRAKKIGWNGYRFVTYPQKFAAADILMTGSWYQLFQ
jgi:hypothetical protein